MNNINCLNCNYWLGDAEKAGLCINAKFYESLNIDRSNKDVMLRTDAMFSCIHWSYIQRYDKP